MKRVKEVLSSKIGLTCAWALISIIAIAMQMMICSPYSFTYDSSYQYALTGKSFSEMFSLLPADYSPPLYAVLLKLVSLVMGESLTYYRLFNGVALAGMLFLCIFPVRNNFGAGTGWLSALMIFCSMINIRAFNDIRPTYLACFFVFGLVVYAFQAYFNGRKSDYIVFTIFSVLCMYTHNIAMVAAFGVYLTCLGCALVQKDHKKFLRFFLSGIVSVVLYIPWLFVLIHQIHNVQEHYWKGYAFSIDLAWCFLFDSVFQYGDYGWLCTLISMITRIGFLIILLRYFWISPKSSMYVLREKIKNGWKECHTSVFRYCFLCLELAVPIAVFAVINENVHRIMTARYFFIFTGVTILLMALPVMKPKVKLLSVAFSLLIVVNFGVTYGMLTKEVKMAEGKQMVEDIQKAHPDGDIAFLHTHEWSIGIMMYFFPDAKHYVYDNTWTVLTDLSVFPSDVIPIGDAENIVNYTDDFYIFDMGFPDAECLEQGMFGENAEVYSRDEYRFAVGNSVGTIPFSLKLKGIRISTES